VIPPVRAGALVVALAALAAPALAQDPPARARRPRFWSRFSAVAGGTLALAGSDFHGQRRFTEFVEEGRIDADYSRAVGPGFELGLEYRLGRRLGASASVNLVSRDASSVYEAAIPHPLYLGQPRRATGSVDGLSYSERAFHFDLFYRLDRGRLRYGVFAGASQVRVSSELLERVQYQQAYPFDEVQVTAVPRGTFGGSALGFNAGAELDYVWGGRVGTLLMARYHRATVDVPQATDDVVALKAGGLQIGAALRLFW
jgi:opacity protein-like surface antigen